MSLRRTLSLALIGLLGVALLALPFATDMFAKTKGVDDLTGAFRDSFTEQALSATNSDMTIVDAMSRQLQDEMLPSLPQALGMTPEQFQAFMTQHYPAASAGIAQLDTVVPRFQGLVAGLNQQADNFRQADSIPTSSLPARTVPLLFVFPGAVLALLAIACLITRRRGLVKGASFAAVIIGLVFIIAPFVLSVPAKAQAVDAMTDSFSTTFSNTGVAQLENDLALVRAMSTQLETQTVPDLAGSLSMSPEQFGQFLNERFPDVATGMQQINAILTRFDTFGEAMGAHVEDFRLAASIPTSGTSTTTFLYWFVVPGAASIVLGIIALPAGDRLRRVDDGVGRDKVSVSA